MHEVDDAPVTSVPQYLEVVLDLAASWRGRGTNAEVWFRGVRSRHFDLRPGTIWRAGCDGEGLFNSFRARAQALLHPPPEDEWDWYFAAQHFGLPTRLLDWSESPLVGLWFAVEDAKPGDEPIVWIMDPSELNRISVNFAYSLSPGGELTNHWLPSRIMSRTKPQTFRWSRNAHTCTDESPIAIDPKRANARITAQLGTFTLHGVGTKCISEYFEGASERLVGIRIGDSSSIKRQLRVMGFDRFAIFPEADSLASSLKEWYGIDS